MRRWRLGPVTVPIVALIIAGMVVALVALGGCAALFEKVDQTRADLERACPGAQTESLKELCRRNGISIEPPAGEPL
jgi:hypothetical protein